MKKIRIGIIGAGNIVKQRHLPGLSKLNDVEVVVVCNKNIENAKEVARNYSIPEISKNWEEIIQRKDIDAVIIGTPPYMHAPISVAAINAGKHVFCQARMAMNLKEALEMYNAAKKHPNQVAMLCPPPNAMKHGKYLIELLKEKIIGNLLHFSLHSLNYIWTDLSAPAHWRQRIELSGNNILSVAIYAEILEYFFGQPEEICSHARVCYPIRHGYEVKIPDFVQVLGKWPNNLYGCLEWSGISQFPPREDLQIYGSEGTLIYDFKTDEIFIGKKGYKELTLLPIPSKFVRTWTVEADFVDAIRNGKQPEPSFLTGLKYMQVLEAVNIAIREHRWVNLKTL